ncbi:MAG: hypothetical protein CBB94_16380 [Gammaproteobacteria bacterium TMED34]|nr:MAG: hypothetical protein CBB94_16380 [Gammaproteobacteria bacterium TMED34]|tara:strand:+ start:79 stop:1011 length:933 start_codon:yes stop_codon:yes gene_type:complete
MKKFKLVLISVIILISGITLNAKTIQIVVKLQNEIITNIDIENEIKYLIFFNPKLKELKIKNLKNIAKNSLITEIIKKKEIDKAYNFNKKNNYFESVERKFLKNKNIDSKSEFIQILNSKNLNYETFKKKLQVEALWNQLIYSKYSKNIRIDENELRQNILIQIANETKKYDYNISEIFFIENINETFEDTLDKLKSSINEVGFENTANIFSISSTAKNGGLIGWVNAYQLSETIKKAINNLKKNEISSPIKIGGGYLLIKINNKKESKQIINVEEQLKELINKETNRQLNTYSLIFYKRLKKNIQIDEL